MFFYLRTNQRKHKSLKKTRGGWCGTLEMSDIDRVSQFQIPPGLHLWPTQTPTNATVEPASAGVMLSPNIRSITSQPGGPKTSKTSGVMGPKINPGLPGVKKPYLYLENKLLLISINFTPKTSHSCLKKWHYVFQVGIISLHL